MRLSTCPCFTLRREPPAATPGAALLMRAGYWLPQGGETPLGAALRRRLRAYLAESLGLAPGAWAQQPPTDEPLAPAHGPGTARLAAVWQWARVFLTSPRRWPITLAWVWPRDRGPLWGVYRWARAAEPWPRPDWGLPTAAEIPLGPGWEGVAWTTTPAPPGSSADEARATAAVPAPRAEPFPPEPRPQVVPTPAAATVEAVARHLGVTPAAVLKTLFWVARVPDAAGWAERLVAALVPGDRRLSPWALAAALGTVALRPATEDEVRAVGAVPGFASPVGLDPARVTVVLDAAAAGRGPWIMGANRPDAHLRFVWPGRDFPVQQVAPLTGTHDPAGWLAWAGRVPAAWLAAEGVPSLPRSDAAAVGLTWLEVDAAAWAAALAAVHRDEHGLVWPDALAPLQVHVVRLRPRREAAAVDALADEVVQRLTAAGWAVLDDDRDASPGVKFTDADLMGLPWRVVVSARHRAARQVEVRARRGGEAALWPVEELPARLAEARG